MLLFSRLNSQFFGYFDPEKNFLAVIINSSRGDLADITDKIIPLPESWRPVHCSNAPNVYPALSITSSVACTQYSNTEQLSVFRQLSRNL